MNFDKELIEDFQASLVYRNSSPNIITPPLKTYVGFYSGSKNEVISNSILTERAIDLSGCFAKCPNLKRIELLEGSRTSKVTAMDGIFAKCPKLSDFSGITRWNVSRCVSYNYAFQGSGINSLSYFKKWKFPSGSSCIGMFLESRLNSLEGITDINFQNISFARDMFGRIDITDLKGSENLDLSNCLDVSGMFYNCRNLKDISIAKTWKLPENANFKSIFQHCPLIKPEDLKRMDLKESSVQTERN